MNENQITELLVTGILERGPQALVDRFAVEVCGLREPLGEPQLFATQQRLRELSGTTRGLVVGLAPKREVSHSTANIGGNAIVDGVVAGSTMLLIENKISGALDWDQLVRHALHWSLPVDRVEPMWVADAVPPGYALTTWETLGGWLARERQRGDGPTAALLDLAQELQSRKLATLDAEAEHAPEAQPLDLELPSRPADPRVLSAAWDYGRVRKGCEELFARSPIEGRDCIDDTRRMREAFEVAGLPVPCGLRYAHRDGAMTPLRVLDTLYRGGGRLTDAYPPEWTGMRMRLTDHGADRAVLLAMLAWAGATKRDSARKNIFGTVPVIWPLTPERSPGLEALHAVVDGAER